MKLNKISSIEPESGLLELLGNYAKSSVVKYPSTSSNDATYSEELLEVKRAQNRALRYEMQDTARTLLKSDFSNSGFDSVKQIKGAYRLIKCRSFQIGPQVGLQRSIKHGKVFYSGLVTCGSVWSCPVCAPIIQQQRQKEISKAMDSAYNDKGLSCSMLTFTFPHYIFESCSSLLEKMAKAFSTFRALSSYKTMRKNIGYVGLIRGLETVYGKNGWHNHTHEIWFHDPKKIRRQKSNIRKMWYHSCKKAGLVPKGKFSAFMKHAFDLKTCVSSGEYLLKSAQDGWGVDNELTKNSLKSNSKGLPPFALLESANDLDDPNSKRNGALFLEFAKAFAGKRQTYWTNGLKEFFSIADLTDEETVEKNKDKAIQLGTLDKTAWFIIRKNKARSLILYLSEKGGFHYVCQWLALHGVPVQHHCSSA
jgi:hypothetical protein